MGRSFTSTRSTAMGGITLIYRATMSRSDASRTNDLLSGRFLSAKTLATAAGLVASQPIPHTVSVGYRMSPPSRRTASASAMISV